jgi:uncharacterized membrane protein HdeD (DUF308 family)
MAEGIVSSWVKDAKKNAGWLIFLGAVSVIVGMMALGSPLMPGLLVAAVVGFFMLVAGISQVVGSFKAGSFGSGTLPFLGGALTTFAGLVMFMRPVVGLKVLTLIIAAYFLADGLSGIALAFRVKPEKGWVWVLFSGVVALLLGIVILGKWPLSGFWVIGTLVGIHLLFRGWSLIAIGMAARSGLSEAQDAIKGEEAV